MVTQTFTFDQFLVYINELPMKIDRGSKEINMEIAKSLQGRIRNRAPQGTTGSLKKVELESKGKNIVLTGPAHWFFVNAGMAPNFPIPFEAKDLHRANPGSTAGKKLSIPREDITGWFVPAQTNIQGKGFVDNSIASLIQDLPTIVERGLNKAFQK